MCPFILSPHHTMTFNQHSKSFSTIFTSHYLSISITIIFHLLHLMSIKRPISNLLITYRCSSALVMYKYVCYTIYSDDLLVGVGDDDDDDDWYIVLKIFTEIFHIIELNVCSYDEISINNRHHKTMYSHLLFIICLTPHSNLVLSLLFHR